LSPIAAVAGPRLVRQAAREPLGLYASPVGVVSARGARRAPPSVAVELPAVFVTLDGSWGLDFLLGLRRFGGVRAMLREQLAHARARLGGSSASPR
jgi:hypothetical protein